MAVTELGGAVIKSRGAEADARPGTLIVLNPGEVQSARMGLSRRWVYRSFYFGPHILQEISRGLGVAKIPAFPSSAIDDLGLIAAFRSLHRMLERPGEDFEIRELLTRAFARMLEHRSTVIRRLDAAPNDRARFRKVAAVLRAHRFEELRLDDLAAAVELNVFQLIRLFKRVAGLTPHAYLVQVRLDDARGHLRNGMPIAEVAMATGFYDQSALTNHFRRSFGITPRQYAKAVRR